MKMMNGDEVISIYESVASITGQMLAAARAGSWDRLVELESLCTAQVARLRAEDAVPAVSGQARERKAEIIMRILEDDRQIREITEPWMAHLSDLIASAGKERRLAKAYGTHRTG